jgi:hypothetical protein
MYFNELFETFKIVAVRSKQRLEDNISILYHCSINLLQTGILKVDQKRTVNSFWSCFVDWNCVR